MAGFGNLGAQSNWSPLTGNGNRRSLAPSNQSNWTGGGRGWSNWGGMNRNLGNRSAQTGQSWGQSSPMSESQPSSSSMGALNTGYGVQPSAASNPQEAYKAAQNAPVKGGYSTVGFDPTPQPPMVRAQPAQNQAVMPPAGSRGVQTPSSAQAMPKPDQSMSAPNYIADKPLAKPGLEPSGGTGGLDPGDATVGMQKPVATAPVGPTLAPTAAEVAANPAAFAGTSFDPSRIISGQVNPAGDGRLANNPVTWQTHMVDPYDFSGNFAYYYGRPFSPESEGMIPIPGNPGHYLTRAGVTWSQPGTPNGPGSPGFEARFNAAMAAGGPEVEQYRQYLQMVYGGGAQTSFAG